MKYLLKKDKKRRNLFKRSELLKVIRHVGFKDLRLQMKFRSLSYMYLLKYDLKSSRSRIINRCVVTGKAASVNRTFHLSRTIFRSMASQGLLTGVKKGSW